MILLKKNDIINYKEVKSMLPEKELELLYDYILSNMKLMYYFGLFQKPEDARDTYNDMVRLLKGMKKK